MRIKRCELSCDDIAVTCLDITEHAFDDSVNFNASWYMLEVTVQGSDSTMYLPAKVVESGNSDKIGFAISALYEEYSDDCCKAIADCVVELYEELKDCLSNEHYDHFRYEDIAYGICKRNLGDQWFYVA